MVRITIEVSLGETGTAEYPLTHYAAECPFCAEEYEETTHTDPGSYWVQPSEDVVGEGRACAHLVDVEDRVATFCRYPVLYATVVGLFTRFQRSPLGLRWRRLKRKLLG